MQKILRRMTIVLATVLAVVCLGVFATACTDDSDKATYTITVQYENGTPVDGTKTGMQVQICLWINATNSLGQCYGTYNVGADGKATIPAEDFWELEANTSYHWQINNAPDGYTYDEESVLMTAPGNLTIVLKPTAA